MLGQRMPPSVDHADVDERDLYERLTLVHPGRRRRRLSPLRSEVCPLTRESVRTTRPYHYAGTYRVASPDILQAVVIEPFDRLGNGVAHNRDRLQSGPLSQPRPCRYIRVGYSQSPFSSVVAREEDKCVLQIPACLKLIDDASNLPVHD